MTPRRYMETLRLPLAAGLAILLAACAGAPVATPVPAAAAAAVPEIRPGVPAGYLDRSAIPDSQALVPAPPATGSAGLAQDHAVMQAALALRGTPRFEQARLDADLDFPFAAGTFSCALGASIDAQSTPATYRLLRRTLIDGAFSTRAAKELHQRTRPFVGSGTLQVFGAQKTSTKRPKARYFDCTETSQPC